MKNLEKLNRNIIKMLIIILLIIVVVVLFLFLFRKNSEEKRIENYRNIYENIGNVAPQKFEVVDNYDIYYTVKGILNNYISRIKEANGDTFLEMGKLQQSKEEIIQTLEADAIKGIYDTFDEKYIEETGITEEDVRDMAQKYRQQGDYNRNIVYDFKIREMYVADILTDMKLVLIDFTINNIEDKILIKLDLSNNTYSIFGKEYLEKKRYTQDTEITNIEISTDRIQSNDYNFFDYVITNDQYIVNQYFSEYQTQLLNQVESAYNMLDEEYRENKYESQQEFTEYVEQNYDSLKSNYLSKYLINQFEEYKEYVCIDANNHYYIFIERSLTDYSVILDTYTVDLIDFTQKYDPAEISTKVGMNVEKVLDAINDGDYRYVYNKLDETFRNNTYGSLENFRVYMEENFYEENDIEYLEFSEEGDTYIYRTRIKNAAEGQSEGKEMTVIMKLLEGTNFVMSFSIG